MSSATSLPTLEAPGTGVAHPAADRQRSLRSRGPAAAGRLARFFGGLALCALAVWLSVRVGLGLSPWDVLHSGLAARLGMPIGVVLIGVGLLVLAGGTLLGVRPGLGTVLNILLVGTGLDALIGSSWLTGLATAPFPVRVAVLVLATALLGLGGAMYISARFGAGPRDSLMVAFAQRGIPVGVARCGIELTVLAAGWALGGRVGVGTLILALGSGPAVAGSFRLLRRRPDGSRR